MVSQPHTTSSLTIGCDLISQKLKYCLSPMSLLFKFEPNPPHRPRPLALTVALAVGLIPVAVLVSDTVSLSEFANLGNESEEYHLLAKSTFLLRLVGVFSLYRICFHFAVFFITLVHYSSMANVMAANNNLVTEHEQKYLASQSFFVFLSKTVANCISYTMIMVCAHSYSEEYLIHKVAVLLVVLLLLHLTVVAPMMYTCYLGAALGQHVENFSKQYVDSMFDQFMKAIELVGNPPSNQLHHSSEQLLGSEDNLNSVSSKKYYCCCGCFLVVYRFIRRSVIYIWDCLCHLGAFLNLREYPELPEMKMTKLSSTTNIQITDTKRIANTHLIRIRLRRTQIMLSELRDMVSDINKVSSPILMMQIIYETVLIILIATASIQARVYKSINLLVLPTATNTIGLVISVVYTCICLDETTSQLKLMINKLFDFIILNHRVQTIRRPSEHVSIASRMAAAERDKEALSETWSQFQYTRKLANTIQFTMGGILPVSRRLVLSTLGHVLSAVFISIEIMSIVDTSQSDSHHEGSNVGFSNSTTPHGKAFGSMRSYVDLKNWKGKFF